MRYTIAIAAILACMVALYPPPRRPLIRLNGVEKALPAGFIIRYSVNGQSYFEIMPNESEVQKYIDYLKEVGHVE